MKPRVSILMVTSIDGGLHPSRFTSSPDGTRRDWTDEYEKLHASLQANAWLVGRVTMAEMSKVGPHAPSGPWKVERPIHVAKKDAATFAVALDRAGKLHFQGSTLSGDHVIVILGRDTPDSHLAELTADGVSYIVAPGGEFDIPSVLDVLSREFGISHLVVEGGAKTNGAFLAAQVVDELRVLVAPGLDGAEQVEGIVGYRNGLTGVVRLKLKSADRLGHGVVPIGVRRVTAGCLTRFTGRSIRRISHVVAIGRDCKNETGRRSVGVDLIVRPNDSPLGGRQLASTVDDGGACTQRSGVSRSGTYDIQAEFDGRVRMAR